MEASSPATKCLLDLPAEIQIQIASNTLWATLKTLSLICKHFSTLLDQEYLRRQHRILRDQVLTDEIHLSEALKQRCKLNGSFRNTLINQQTQVELPLHTFPGQLVHNIIDVELHDARPGLSTWSSPIADHIPCYTCLCWLPIAKELLTHAPPIAPNGNYFSLSRVMRSHAFQEIRNVANPNRSYTRYRICIPCGARTGFYRPGEYVAQHLICMLCREVEYRPGPKYSGWGQKRWHGPPTFQERFYCKVCQEIPDIKWMDERDLESLLEKERTAKKWARRVVPEKRRRKVWRRFRRKLDAMESRNVEVGKVVEGRCCGGG